MADRKRVRICGPFFICVYIAILVAAVVWLKVSDAPVVYQAPPRAELPYPNAYDTYVRAAKSLVCTRQTAEAIASKPPVSKHPKPAPPLPKSLRVFLSPRFNARWHVPKTVDKTPLPPGVPKASTLTRLYNSAEKRAILRANAKALSDFREGLKQDCRPPEGSGILSREYSSLRELARAVALEAMMYRESGEFGKAIAVCMDGLELGNDTSKGGTLLIGLVSVAIQSIARKGTREIVDSLNLAETRKAIARLSGIISEAVLYKSIMVEERRHGLYLSLLGINAPNWRQQYASFDLAEKMISGEPLTLLDRIHYACEYAKTYGMSRRGLFAGSESDYAKQIAAAELSYADSRKLKIPGSNKITRMLIPICSEGRFKFEDNRCMNDILLLQLSLHAYKLERGRYPGKLSDLTVGYIKSVPMDPFAIGAAYRYNLTPKGYTLYSLGPDMKDDGGKPIIRPQSPKLWRVDPEDKGDIVAGYNR